VPYRPVDLIQNEVFPIIFNKITGRPIPRNTPFFRVPQGSEFILGHFEIGSPRRGIDFYAY
jgi:hypothetical protein